ncbi:MAG TPA: ABC transporter substrate-binding protein [Candidatus Limnocylindrales bacterium]|nr:ABC transporter substrate-binding protein [Candidatus Limnocylindrales bacterium]
MPKPRRLSIALAPPVPLILLVLVALVAAACGAGGPLGGDKPTVRIGSTNFAEQLIVGELYGQILEANGYTVERRFNLGNREIVFPALESGEIDMEVDYLATLLAFVDPDATGSTDPDETIAALREALAPRGLTVLDYAPAVDQNGIVVTRETAERYGLTKISDLAPIAGDLVFGGPPECPNREFCAIGLRDVYGITFKEFKPLDVGGPVTVQALEAGEIDVALLFTSDAVIAVRDFVLLDDDRSLQLSDNVAPVVRNDLLDRAPDDFERLINSVSEKLTTEELTELNRQVGVERRDPDDVAREWLQRQGLIQ